MLNARSASTDGDPVVFAGLREYWKGEDGTELRTATVITTEAGPDMPIHNRRPVVLERDIWEHWIEPDLADRDELESLLRPTTENTLVQCRVSRDVGPIRNDGPELVEEVSVP